MAEWSDTLRQEIEALEPSRRQELLLHALSEQRLPQSRRIFTNRTLRMEKIRHVGFDLDWTLADYHHDTMSLLAFELTLERLVERHGYPKGILRADFRTAFCRRGLILDTEAGTVLKMNRHRYVGRAYHGRRFLDPEERSRLYRREPLNPNSKRFHFVDTLFELPEVNIFSELSELKRNRALDLPPYGQLFKDIRTAIDSIHADGTLKHRILGDLDRYLPIDPELSLALERLATSGRRLLLITNSEWYYTQGLCAQLLGPAWRELFDLVVVEARKPAFFRRAQAFEELDDEGRPQGEVTVPGWGGLYRGGSREGLMQLLGGHGEQVLYVGDHIYGDVVSSKLSSTWRTALVVSELEHELEVRQDLVSQQTHARVLRAELGEFGRRMDELDDVLKVYRELVQSHRSPGRSLGATETLYADLRQEHKAMRHHLQRLQLRISKAINPYWGSLFKQGGNKSLFGSQIDDFACVYTSRVSNFCFYGSNYYFRVLFDPMMHETSI